MNEGSKAKEFSTQSFSAGIPSKLTLLLLLLSAFRVVKPYGFFGKDCDVDPLISIPILPD